MIALLLGWGAKLLARPALLVGLVSAVAIGGMAIKAKIEAGRHARAVASLRSEIATRDATIANLHLSIAQERLNVGTLTARVREQNNAIALMQLKATEAETAASLAAVRAFNQGRSVADALRAPTTTVPPGDAAMNGWLVERFK